MTAPGDKVSGPLHWDDVVTCYPSCMSSYHRAKIDGFVSTCVMNCWMTNSIPDTNEGPLCTLFWFDLRNFRPAFTRCYIWQACNVCCNSVSSEETTNFPRVKSLQLNVCVASFLNPPLMRLRPEGVRVGWNDSQLVMTPPPPPTPHSCWTLKDALSPQIISLCAACSAACSVV